jgi:hypothetical protein
MLKKALEYAVIVPLLVAISGCLIESTLDAKGGGVMTLTYGVVKPEELPSVKKKMESSAVKVLSAELEGSGDKRQAVFKLQFDDVTKLPTTQFFNNVRITRADGSKPNTKVLTAKVKHDKPVKMPDGAADVFGKEVKVQVTLPGEVVESNATSSSGSTVTWTWGLSQFFEQTDLTLTATYKEPGASGTPGKTAAAK